MTNDPTSNKVDGNAPESSELPQVKSGPVRKLFRWLKLGFKILGLLLGSYLAIVAIGLFPVNRDFVEPESGIEIFVFSGEFHSDLIVPIKTEVIDWRSKFSPSDFKFSSEWATHISFGWGDREFYLNTPSWSDLKFSTATSALFMPSETVMHVGFETTPPENYSIRSVTISNEQYERLVEFVHGSFALDQSETVQLIPDANYVGYDAFYKGEGSYSCFKTCNCWVGQAIKSAGIKTGWFTPLPKTPFWYFPD